MFKLPTKAATKEMFELSDLANWKKLPTFRVAIHNAQAFLAVEKGAKSVNMLTLRADGHVYLIQVRASGSWKKIWDFGRADSKAEDLA